MLWELLKRIARERKKRERDEKQKEERREREEKHIEEKEKTWFKRKANINSKHHLYGN